MANCKKNKNSWNFDNNPPTTDFEKKIQKHISLGHLVPSKGLIKTPEQIEGIRKAGIINTAALDLVGQVIKEGMTTAEVDRIVHDFIISKNAQPACLGYDGFPKSCCISINEVVCHGIPSEDEEFWDGDIVNVDITTILNGYYADASRMFIIGKTSPENERLVRVTKECLEIGAAAARPWGFVGDIGKAIEKHARKNGYTVVRDLAGHGTGLAFHEDPEVDHYNTHKKGMLLVPGMVFTIEPMINMGGADVFIDEEDGWTVVTEDEKPSAQWEHTFLMTEEGLEVLTH